MINKHTYLSLELSRTRKRKPLAEVSDASEEIRVGHFCTPVERSRLARYKQNHMIFLLYRVVNRYQMCVFYFRADKKKDNGYTQMKNIFVEFI